MVMKRSYVLAVALLCLLLGGVLSQLSTHRNEAQGGQIGRYQLFRGNYMEAGKEVDHLFRIDTVTGKTDEYTRKAVGGAFEIHWAPIP